MKTAIRAGDLGMDADYAANVARTILDIPLAIISNIRQSDTTQQIREMFRGD